MAQNERRVIERASHVGQSSLTCDDESPLIKLLAGTTWKSQAQGWNLIALPFHEGGKKDSFRLLMNQYGETLRFHTADACVANRGMTVERNKHDQRVDGLSYEQIVTQIDSADFPKSKLMATNGDPIHHEPGFFLHLRNHVIDGHTEELGQKNGPKVKLEIARLASIPHGNSVLAMGTAEFEKAGKTKIDADNAFPERFVDDKDINNAVKNSIKNKTYLEPYQQFIERPFFGNVPKPQNAGGFPGFSPDNVHAILKFARKGLKVKKTTTLNFDTKFRNDFLTSAPPIANIPFVNREAETTEMHAIFWIMELEQQHPTDPIEYVMQYTQTVYLEFFNSPIVKGKRIRWPHVSINTLIRAI